MIGAKYFIRKIVFHLNKIYMISQSFLIYGNNFHDQQSILIAVSFQSRELDLSLKIESEFFKLFLIFLKTRSR